MIGLDLGGQGARGRLDFLWNSARRLGLRDGNGVLEARDTGLLVGATGRIGLRLTEAEEGEGEKASWAW